MHDISGMKITLKGILRVDHQTVKGSFGKAQTEEEIRRPEAKMRVIFFAEPESQHEAEILTKKGTEKGFVESKWVTM